MEFFDRSGAATVYSPDGEHIYTWAGAPVAYLHGDKLYSFGGRPLGWLRNGWLINLQGYPALFLPESTGGPLKPVRKIKPVKSVRRVRPIKGVRQIFPVRPVVKLTWGEIGL